MHDKLPDQKEITGRLTVVSTFILVCFAALFVSAAAAATGFDRDEALAISRDALGRSLPDISLTDTTGRKVDIDRYAGKPLVISMIFTSCYHICPTTTRHLDEVVGKARDVLGDESFNVITVGFDTFRDTPPMMAEFARSQDVKRSGWDFLSGEKQTVDELAATLGFQYTAAGSGFDHLIQTTIVDAEGRVYQQVYGMQFEAPLMIEPLKRLVFRTAESDGLFENLSKQVRLFCTVYDPASDRYRFDYSLFIGMFIGFMCIGVLGTVLVREWRKTLASGSHG